MADRPFLKRGTGPIDKYKLEDARQLNQKLYAQTIDLRNQLKQAQTDAENFKKEVEMMRAESLLGCVDQLQLEDAKQLNEKLYTQTIDLRNQSRRAQTDAENFKKEREIEGTRARSLQECVEQLESEAAILRGQLALNKKRDDREIIDSQKAQASLYLQARSNFDTIANRQLGLKDSGIFDVSRNGRGSGSAESVQWADHQQPVTWPALAASSQSWKLFSSEVTPTGQKKIYMNIEGTKMEERDCGCTLYDYRNGDALWKSSVGDIEIAYKNGLNEVRFKEGFVMRLFNNGQLDLVHGDGQTTSIRPDGTRLEKKLDASRGWVTEIFNPKRGPLRMGMNVGRGWTLAGIDVWMEIHGDVWIYTPKIEIFRSARNHMVEIYHVEKKNIFRSARNHIVQIYHVGKKNMNPCFDWGRQK